MKKKLTLSLDPELNRRLDIQAAVAGKGHDRSSIVDALVAGHIQLPDDWQSFADAGDSTAEPTEDKTSGRQREKTTFYLSALAALKLGLHSQLAGTNRSRVVEALIEAHIPQWGVYDQRESYVTTRSKDRRSRASEISAPVSAVA